MKEHNDRSVKEHNDRSWVKHSYRSVIEHTGRSVIEYRGGGIAIGLRLGRKSQSMPTFDGGGGELQKE